MKQEVNFKMMKHQSIRINGIHCADCVKEIEKNVNKIKGVSELHLSFATSQLTVTYDTKQVSMPEIKRAVENLGYDILEAEIEEKKVLSIKNYKFLFTVVSGTLFFIGLGIFFFTSDLQFIILNNYLTLSELLFIMAMVFGGYYILKESVKDLLEKERLHLNMV